MKTLLVAAFCIVCLKSFSQVGINTVTPDSQLDIAASSASAPTINDGILIPRINVFPASNPTALQNSMLVYLTTASGTNLPGFYYWNNATSSWIGIGNSTNWNLNGNLGTNAATNFIGTLDNNDIVFKRNNTKAGKIESSNTSLGVNAFNVLNTGVNNTAFGDNALSSNTTGNYNVATGSGALNANTIATRNTATGVNSLFANTSGSYNTANGVNALKANTTAYYNTAIGSETLLNNTIGTQNSAIGSYSMHENTTGNFNFGSGVNSLFSNIGGNENTAVGNNALHDNTTGSYNVAIGMYGLYSNKTGINNVAVGSYTLANSLIAGDNNTGVGGGALDYTVGSNNTGIGYHSGFNLTTGSNNMTLGANASVQSPTVSNQLSIADVIYGTTMSSTALGKIGIGEPNPSAKLQITSSSQSAPANTDGIIIPKVNAFAVTNPTISQQGMMVYLNAVAGNNLPGFYYWDNTSTSWIGVGAKNNWGLYGNAATNPTTNFIGTSDNTDLSINTNSTMVMKLTAAGNVGVNNSVPLQKLDVNGNINLKNFSNTFRINNNPVLSLSTSNTRNILVGTNAGPTTGGSDNCFVGDLAGFAGVSTAYNTLVGSKAGYNNYQGSDNIFIGMQAGFTAPQSQANLFIGNSAGYNFNSGFENVFIGHESGKTLTGSSNNTFVGFKSGSAGATGYYNCFLGAESGYNNTGTGNVFLGTSTGASNSGDDNTFTGSSTGFTNTTGNYNCFYGSLAGAFNTTASYNSFFGMDSGYTNQTGASNAFFGAYSGNKSDANYNCFFGVNSGYKTTSGANNTMMGYAAGQENVAGTENTYVGSWASIFTVGNYNTSLGYKSGASAFTGSTNTFIGYKADGISALTNATAIGANSVVGASNSLVLGGTGASAVKVGIGVTVPSSELEINGYTKLGSNAPAIKTLKLIGTSGAVQGSTTTIAHGLNSTKILAVNILLDFAAGSSIPPSYNGNTGYEYNFYTTTTDIVVFTKTGNSANILSKPFRILITYEQ